MKSTDFAKFIVKRVKNDSRKAFTFRMIRFAILAFYKAKMWFWWRNVRADIAGDIVCNIQGSQMRFSVDDGGITQDLLHNGIREPYATDAFRSLIKSGDVVVEIGANVGYYALQEAKIVGDKGQVYAIEPLFESVCRLKENITRNNYRNIAVFEQAIGMNNGDAVLYRTKESNLCTLSELANRHYDRSYTVPVQRLDHFIFGKRYPNVIRMDIEGYEYQALLGMQGILWEEKPLALFIEMHLDLLGEKVKDMAKLLKKHKFEVVSASCEPHPAVMGSKRGRMLTAMCDKRIGAPQGYINLTVDDLLSDPIYSSGQVEWLEVIFGR